MTLPRRGGLVRRYTRQMALVSQDHERFRGIGSATSLDATHVEHCDQHESDQGHSQPKPQHPRA